MKHEIEKYPRKGFMNENRKFLKKGEIVEHIDTVFNFYGTFFRVMKDGDDWEYDIPTDCAIEKT